MKMRCRSDHSDSSRYAEENVIWTMESCFMLLNDLNKVSSSALGYLMLWSPLCGSRVLCALEDSL